MIIYMTVEFYFDLVNVKKQKSWCSTLLTHVKSLCLKVTLFEDLV
jgi:hypothetical protein